MHKRLENKTPVWLWHKLNDGEDIISTNLYKSRSVETSFKLRPHVEKKAKFRWELVEI